MYFSGVHVCGGLGGVYGEVNRNENTVLLIVCFDSLKALSHWLFSNRVSPCFTIDIHNKKIIRVTRMLQYNVCFGGYLR